MAALLREAADRLDRIAAEDVDASAGEDLVIVDLDDLQPRFAQPGSVVVALTEALRDERRALNNAEARLASTEATLRHAAAARDDAYDHLELVQEGFPERLAHAPDEAVAEARFESEQAIAHEAIATASERLDRATMEAHEARAAVARLQESVAGLEAELATRREQRRQSAPSQPSDAPVRLLALRALEELRAPATSGVLGEFIQVRFGREIRTDRWGALRRDEQRSYQSHQRRDKSRDVWLCPAIDPDSGDAVTGLWTRSDWPWSLRLKVEDHDTLELRLLFRLGRLAIDPPAGTFDPEGLVALARRELDRVGGLGFAQTTLEEIDERCEVIRRRLLEASPGDDDVTARGHDPADDSPPDPPWIEHAQISDKPAGRLFGVEADIPF